MGILSLINGKGQNSKTISTRQLKLVSNNFFKEELRKGYFLFPSQTIGWMTNDTMVCGKWANFSFSEAAVLFAVLTHANKQKIAFPSEERIGAFTGLTRKTVRKALRELDEKGFIAIHKKITAAGNYCKKIHVKVPNEQNSYMRMYHKMFDGGIWRRLRPAAKKVYPVLRFFAEPHPPSDFAFYQLFGNDAYPYDLATEMWGEYYPRRRSDMFRGDRNILCQFAGIDRRSLNGALKDLYKIVLIDFPEEFEGIRVWIEPPYKWGDKELNAEIEDKGGVH